MRATQHRAQVINRAYETETAALHEELVRLRQVQDEVAARKDDDLAVLRQKANLMHEVRLP